MAGELATLHQGEGADAAQGSGGVGGAAPDGLELMVPHAGEEEGGLLALEGRQSLGQGVLGPALRVGLDRVFEEAGEGLGQQRGERREAVMDGEVRGLGYEEVVAECEGFGELGRGKARLDAAEGFECGQFVVEAALGGHCL